MRGHEADPVDGGEGNSEAGTNLPISEQFRIIAKRWVDADTAASLMEKSKDTVQSKMINDLLAKDFTLAISRAEANAKSSRDWEEYVKKMVELRGKANLLKVQLEYLRMRHSEQQSHEATARAEMKL